MCVFVCMQCTCVFVCVCVCVVCVYVVCVRVRVCAHTHACVCEASVYTIGKIQLTIYIYSLPIHCLCILHYTLHMCMYTLHMYYVAYITTNSFMYNHAKKQIHQNYLCAHYVGYCSTLLVICRYTLISIFRLWLRLVCMESKLAWGSSDTYRDMNCSNIIVGAYL